MAVTVLRPGVPASGVAAARGAAVTYAVLYMLATPGAAQGMVHPAAAAGHGTYGGPFIGPVQRRGFGEGAQVLAVVGGFACFVAVAVIVAIRLVVFDFDLVLARRFGGIGSGQGIRSRRLSQGSYRAQEGSGEKTFFSYKPGD